MPTFTVLPLRPVVRDHLLEQFLERPRLPRWYVAHQYRACRPEAFPTSFRDETTPPTAVQAIGELSDYERRLVGRPGHRWGLVYACTLAQTVGQWRDWTEHGHLQGQTLATVSA